jgi:multiple sugar transport system permease protein
MPPIPTFPVARAPRRTPLRRRLAPYLFLAPFFATFGVFVLFPLGYSLYLSLFRDRMVGGRHFVGAENYLRAATDPKLWEGIANLALFGLVQIPVMLGLALIFAVVLDRGRVPGKAFFRIGFFLPYAIPSVIAALVWGYLYGPVFGPFAQGARAFGLPAPDFLAPEAILWSIANIVTWEFVGYNMVIFYAALKAIPPDLEEAARIDGATPWRFASTIQLPLLAPTILMAVLFSINGTLQLFNEPYLMRALAANTITSSFTPNLYAYALATAGQQTGYAAAVSVVLGSLVALLSIGFVRLARTRIKALA